MDRREIAMFAGLVKALWKVFVWCQEKGRHEFKMNQVREMLGRNEYARFGDWVLFGGLVYKNGKANYGLNMERCDRFFANDLQIPSKIWKDPMTNELEKIDYRTAWQIPGLMEFLNEDFVYQAKYFPKDDKDTQQIKKLSAEYELGKVLDNADSRDLPPLPLF